MWFARLTFLKQRARKRSLAKPVAPQGPLLVPPEYVVPTVPIRVVSTYIV